MGLGCYNPYDYDIAILKQFGNEYRLTLHSVLRKQGFECDDEKKRKKGSVNDEKLLCNLRRTKQTIFELAICNDWDYFCTFTLDSKKYDRYNLKKFQSDFTQLIRDLRKKYQCDIAYLLIPEKHKNGAWHMHGFIKGLPDNELRLFSLDEKLGSYIIQKLKNGDTVVEWTSYRKKFGFCDLEPINNLNKASAYVTKYVTKDLLNSVQELNHKSYYCSKGLNRSIVLKKGHLAQCPSFDFENEYVKIKTSHNLDELLNLFSE